MSVTDASAFAYRVERPHRPRDRDGREAAGRSPRRSPAARARRAFRRTTGSTTVTIDGESYRGRFVPVTASPGPPVRLGVLSPSATVSQQIADEPPADRLLSWPCSCCSPSSPSASWSGRSQARSRSSSPPPAVSRAATSASPCRSTAATSSPRSGASSTTCPSSSRPRSRRSSASARSSRRRSAASATRSPPASTAQRRRGAGRAARRWTPARQRRAGRCRWPAARSRDASVGKLQARSRARSRRPSGTRSTVSPDVGPELLGALEADERGGAHAPRRGRASAGRPRALDARCDRWSTRPEYLGVDLDRPPREAVHARRGGAARVPGRPGGGVGRERDLHETVERQAVTDELTGLANVRALPRHARPRDGAEPPLRHPARARDAGPRRLQARERHLRPPAGRRGAGAGRGCAAGELSRDIDEPPPATGARSWR